MCLIQRTGHETTEKKRDALRFYQLQCHFFGCQPVDCINTKPALEALQKEHLASFMEHLNTIDRTMKIPKYLVSLVYGKT